MFNKGDKVKVLPYSRPRTIFNNSDCDPGTTIQYKGGWTGVVTEVFSEPVGRVEVLRDGMTDGWYFFDESEIEKLPT